jgi:hypothetical protein
MRNEESVLTIDRYGNKYWKNKAGEYHRIGGPAIEYSNGAKSWYQNGERHRIDGPAIEYSNGNKFYFLRGQHFETKEAFFDALTDEEKEIAIFSEDFFNV